MGFFSRRPSQRVREATAQQLLRAFKTTDLRHVEFILGIDRKDSKGLTHELAMRLVNEFPSVAQTIIGRRYSSWEKSDHVHPSKK